jgi:hypothetical protein
MFLRKDCYAHPLGQLMHTYMYPRWYKGKLRCIFLNEHVIFHEIHADVIKFRVQAHEAMQRSSLWHLHRVQVYVLVVIRAEL